MLDQAGETTELQDEAPATGVQFDEEKAWEAVIAASPAMNRLPDMVANDYDEESYPDKVQLKEVQDATRSRVRSGILFVYTMIENNVNQLFEQFDICFGHAIDILMDDLEASYIEDETSVENYSVEEGCGRLFAYIAIDAYCCHRHDNGINDGSPIDMTTGWFQDLEALPIALVLEKVLKCVKMTPQCQADVRKEAMKVIHYYIFLLLEPDKRTVWH